MLFAARRTPFDSRKASPLRWPALVSCAILLSTGPMGCDSSVAPTPTLPPTVLRIGFADSVRPLMELVVPVYGDEVPTVSFETKVGHVAGLLADLRTGLVEAILVPGVPAGDEEWWTSVIALDGLALIANPENQVTGLTLEQAQAVFQGQIWNWQTLGWAPAEIEVVTREEGSAMWDWFQSLVLEEHRVTLTAVVMPDTAGVLDYVASHRWAIGYVAAASVDDGVRLLAVSGLYPSLETLAEQRYPLQFPISFIARQEPAGPLRQFPAWLLSRDGQAVIGRRYGRVR